MVLCALWQRQFEREAPVPMHALAQQRRARSMGRDKLHELAGLMLLCCLYSTENHEPATEHVAECTSSRTMRKAVACMLGCGAHPRMRMRMWSECAVYRRALDRAVRHGAKVGASKVGGERISAVSVGVR